MEEFRNKDEYLLELDKRGLLPEGFKTSSVQLKFSPQERETFQPMEMDLTLISINEPTDQFAAVFTKNAFPGFPVLIGREFLKKEKISGVLINNRISNVRCPDGKETGLNIVNELQRISGSEAPYFPSSTGIIGWRLPETEICDNLEKLYSKLDINSFSQAAKTIMTTDAFPKVRSASIGSGRICAIAKGAGMIEPDMATMLVFVLTDININRNELTSIFTEVIDETFNRISVDSDQSTSDSAMIFSSRLKECKDKTEFKKVLFSVCSSLARDIVKNGEGTSHLISVKVQEASCKSEALGIGKALINSPLTKTAIFGNDPNVGRFLQAIGDYFGKKDNYINPDIITISIGDQTVFNNGFFTLDESKEHKLNNYMKECAFDNGKGYPPHNKSVDLVIKLGRGTYEAEVLGSDLTYEYVRENADYRT